MTEVRTIRERGAPGLVTDVPVGEPPEEMPDVEAHPINGLLFRKFRLWHGLTQKRMAAETGAHIGTYVAWEHGRRHPALNDRAVRNLLHGLHCRLRHELHTTGGNGEMNGGNHVERPDRDG